MSKTLTSHGGDIYTEGILKGEELIDFSSNINMLGVPESFNLGVIEAMKYINCYPDIQYRETKAAILSYHNIGVLQEDIILGNGAAEVLDLAISRVKSLCVIAPSFSEYTLSAKKYGVEIIYSYLTGNMEYDYEDILEKLKGVEGLIIANPNNPNGLGIESLKFIEILDYCENNNKIIIIDEAFVEFLGEDKSLLKYVHKYKCLIIVRAITKYFALPGVRVGWAISTNKDLVKYIKGMQLPWNINTLGALCLKYILKDKDYITNSLRANNEEREFLLRRLRELSIFKRIYNTNSNFVLCSLNELSDDEFFRLCLENRILIRKCGMYEGLDNSHIRLAIKSRENNLKLLEVLQKLI